MAQATMCLRQRPVPPLAARLLLALLVLLVFGRTAAALPVDAEAGSIDLWPGVGLLAETGRRLESGEALRRVRDFQPPQVPHANLGARHDAVWLRVPLEVSAAGSGRWMFDIDYPSLDRVDLYVVRDGRIVREEELGDHLAYADRKPPARSLLVPVELEPGRYELLLRVQTTGALIVPLRLTRETAYAAAEATLQFGQGLAAGIGLTMVLFALSHWLGSREPMYLYYAVSVLGMCGFFFSYVGLGSQHVWQHSHWLTQNVTLLTLMTTLASGFMLIERTLDVRTLSPRVSRLMQALMLLSWLMTALFVAGVLGYSGAHLFLSIVGPLPLMLAVPAAWVRWRSGDPVAPYVFVGFGSYSVGVALLALLTRGFLGLNQLTEHAHQIGWIVDALAWQRVLALRNQQARVAAERADREREVLVKLAHTDPLTGLPNRRGLETELVAALPQASAERLLAVCLIDLDGFKAVNDRLGHDGGDALLVAVAQRMRAELRRGDVVARLGGDEFVILARDLGSEQDAWQLGDKLMQRFALPFQISGASCRVGLTMGFALAPLDGSDASALLKRADAAMYAGKQSGKGMVRRGQASAGLAGV